MQIDPQLPDDDGWIHAGPVMEDGKDSRHLVSLEQGGMSWVGIRSFHSGQGAWFNGSEPEMAMVRAWQKLPEPTKSFWQRGILHGTQTKAHPHD